jgi:hypothetical protein
VALHPGKLCSSFLVTRISHSFCTKRLPARLTWKDHGATV